MNTITSTTSGTLNVSKYTADTIRNNLTSICNFAKCTIPQRKAMKQILCGLIDNREPILNQLAREEEKATTKKQSEKLGKHLGNVDLIESVNKMTLKKASKFIEDETVIAYDLTDITKNSAKKMEGISEVFDGSKREKANGYTLHGVGIADFLIRLDIHNQDTETLPQRRRKIIEEIVKKVKLKGIWAFDRGNDSGDFFRYLSRRFLRFIIRLKSNRDIFIKETGEVIKLENMKPGRYIIYIKNSHNNKFDTENEYLLVINEHLSGKKPIRLICSTKLKNKNDTKLVKLYLQRWGGTENHFKRIKSIYKLEKIRVMKYNRIINLVSLVLLASTITSWLWKKTKEVEQIKQEENINIQTEQLKPKQSKKFCSAISIYLQLLYKQFIKKKSLTFNQHSFSTFLKGMIPKNLRFRTGGKPPNNPLQLSLFDFFGEKVGVI